MYEEEVSQYFTAKRMAAKRLFGRAWMPPADLPSNGEIQEARFQLADLTEGDARLDRLDAMRELALEVMRALADFEPRLIGSVATGHVRRGSDVDIQLFPDDPDDPEARVRSLRWPYEREDVVVHRGPRVCEHLHLDLEHRAELTVYPRRELRNRPRSSTDGKPIQRLSICDVEALLDG